MQIFELDASVFQGIFGSFDANAALIESAFDVRLRLDNGSLKVEGPREAEASELINILTQLYKRGEELTGARVKQCIDIVLKGGAERIFQMSEQIVAVTVRGQKITPKTLGQSRYFEAMQRSSVVFAVGPAGSGKTFLAVAFASRLLKSGEIKRIILTRPVIEAGEKLGFLPGDLQMKIDPYLRPLYDALTDMLGTEPQRLIEDGKVEIAPLAYMRGRTLKNAFIILDEAQNTTSEQMKMFLTRFGENSRVVVTGDDTQTDLPKDKISGLSEALAVLKNVEGIETVRLDKSDVVRHEMVRRIVAAYNRYEKRNKEDGKQ